MKKEKALPFHRSVIEIMKSGINTNEFYLLLKLIDITKIPKGHHDRVIWWVRHLSAGFHGYAGHWVCLFADDTIKILLEQKRQLSKN